MLSRSLLDQYITRDVRDRVNRSSHAWRNGLLGVPSYPSFRCSWEDDHLLSSRHGVARGFSRGFA